MNTKSDYEEELIVKKRLLQNKEGESEKSETPAATVDNSKWHSHLTPEERTNYEVKLIIKLNRLC